MRVWSGALPVVVALALASAGCMRNIIDELPSGPGAPEAPSPSPSPIGAPEPVPSPTPTIIPTPVPKATPTPEAPHPVSACTLPPGTGAGGCPRSSSAFHGDVRAAIEEVIRTNPEMFKARGCQGCYDVLDVEGYLGGVVEAVAARGYCAMYDGEELAVKNTNDFNEQFDILTSGNAVRSGPDTYRSTCRPAWF
jgi:hypothetical protein